MSDAPTPPGQEAPNPKDTYEVTILPNGQVQVSSSSGTVSIPSEVADRTYSSSEAAQKAVVEALRKKGQTVVINQGPPIEGTSGTYTNAKKKSGGGEVVEEVKPVVEEPSWLSSQEAVSVARKAAKVNKALSEKRAVQAAPFYGSNYILQPTGGLEGREKFVSAPSGYYASSMVGEGGVRYQVFVKTGSAPPSVEDINRERLEREQFIAQRTSEIVSIGQATGTISKQAIPMTPAETLVYGKSEPYTEDVRSIVSGGIYNLFEPLGKDVATRAQAYSFGFITELRNLLFKNIPSKTGAFPSYGFGEFIASSAGDASGPSPYADVDIVKQLGSFTGSLAGSAILSSSLNYLLSYSPAQLPTKVSTASATYNTGGKDVSKIITTVETQSGEQFDYISKSLKIGGEGNKVVTYTRTLPAPSLLTTPEAKSIGIEYSFTSPTQSILPDTLRQQMVGFSYTREGKSIGTFFDELVTLGGKTFAGVGKTQVVRFVDYRIPINSIGIRIGELPDEFTSLSSTAGAVTKARSAPSAPAVTEAVKQALELTQPAPTEIPVITPLTGLLVLPKTKVRIEEKTFPATTSVVVGGAVASQEKSISGSLKVVSFQPIERTATAELTSEAEEFKQETMPVLEIGKIQEELFQSITIPAVRVSTKTETLAKTRVSKFVSVPSIFTQPATPAVKSGLLMLSPKFGSAENYRNLFRALIKERGEFKPITGFIPLEQAKMLGEARAAKSLSRQFRLEPLRKEQPVPRVQAGEMFRQYKISKGKEVFTPLTFIQKTKFSLSSLEEKMQIQAERRKKKGAFKFF